MKSTMMGIFLGAMLTSSMVLNAGTYLISSVPPEVIKNFENTFKYNTKGEFVGAKISMLTEYLNDEEIVKLVSEYAKLPEQNIFLHYKWKKRGEGACVKDSDWVCVLVGEIQSTQEEVE